MRRPRGTAEQVAAVAVAVALVAWLLQAAAAVFRTVLSGWPILAALAVCGVVAVVILGLRRQAAGRVRAQRLARLRLTLAEIDSLSDQEFEFTLRDLLIRDGWSARQVGQQGDQAADVIGQDPRRGRIVLQARPSTPRSAGKSARR